MADQKINKNVRNPSFTRSRLLEAAATEFNTRGFFDTDTNRIARLAGFAPQTFYRHFQDKNEIFAEVYREWIRSELTALEKAFQGMKRRNREIRVRKAAQILVRHHSEWAVFRRSLRQLTIENPMIRAVRTESREEQIRRIAGNEEKYKARKAEILALLLSTEAILDAAADDLIGDFGINKSDWIKQIEACVSTMMELQGQEY